MRPYGPRVVGEKGASAMPYSSVYGVDVTRMQPQPEFSRPVDTSGLGVGERIVEFEADTGERAALVARFGLRALDRLSATVRLARAKGSAGAIRLHASLAADVVQSCVVTSVPVPTPIEETVELLFAPVNQSATCREVVIDALGDDPPEPLVDGIIDVGEVVAQQLALALDPYPRAADAVLNGAAWNDELADGPPGGPFARLRERKGSG